MKSYKKVLEMDVPSDNPNSAAVDAGGILGRMGCRMWPKLWIISKQHLLLPLLQAEEQMDHWADPVGFFLCLYAMNWSTENSKTKAQQHKDTQGDQEGAKSHPYVKGF